MGVSPADGARMPLVLQTSGGTTGLPRPMLYAPRDRETMAILGGRRFALHGVQPGDRVMVTYSLGLGNGGMAPREAIWRYTGAIPIMTGSGASTPTRRQIEIAKAWGVNVILGFPSYLRHLAIVAKEEMGIDPHSLGIRTLGSHLGQEDRERIEELWNAPCHDAYGTHESGMMAAECGARAGMHIQEDAVILEIADTETGAVLPEGEKGAVYITTLYRWGAPQIRFNINDISRDHSRAVPMRRHAEAARPHLRPQRHDGEAARRQRVSRSRRRRGGRRCAQQRRVRVHRRAHGRGGSRGDDGDDRGACSDAIARRCSATSSSASRKCSASA